MRIGNKCYLTKFGYFSTPLIVAAAGQSAGRSEMLFAHLFPVSSSNNRMWIMLNHAHCSNLFALNGCVGNLQCVSTKIQILNRTSFPCFLLTWYASCIVSAYLNMSVFVGEDALGGALTFKLPISTQ